MIGSTGNVYVDVLVVVTTLLTVLIMYFKWLFTYWERQGVFTQQPTIPFGNAGNLFFGQRNGIGLEMENVYNEIKARGLRYGGFYFFGKPIFVPIDLDLVKRMFTEDFEHFTNHVSYCNEEIDPMSGNVFALKGSKWKNMRGKLTSAFTSGKMKMMFQTLLSTSEELKVLMKKTVDERGPIDIKDIVSRFTIDVIASCGFGIECNSLKNPKSEFREEGHRLVDGSFIEAIKQLLVMTIPEILYVLRIPNFSQQTAEFFQKIVEETVSVREEQNIIRKDFIHLLIQLKNNVKITDDSPGRLKPSTDTRPALTLNEMAAQALIFFGAGFETSSATTTFCLYELVQNPELQVKVREEIIEVLNKHGKITYEALAEMTYMDKCINETLRKYPSLPVHTRECTKTYKVPNSQVTLKKGSFVFIPTMGIQHDPDYYPDPEKFDPGRFGEESVSTRHVSAWTPFGYGPRTCIGLRFGIMQIKVALTTLLQSYKFTLNSKTKTPLVMDNRGLVLASKEDIWLNVEKV